MRGRTKGRERARVRVARCMRAKGPRKGVCVSLNAVGTQLQSCIVQVDQGGHVVVVMVFRTPVAAKQLHDS